MPGPVQNLDARRDPRYGDGPLPAGVHERDSAQEDRDDRHVVHRERPRAHRRYDGKCRDPSVKPGRRYGKEIVEASKHFFDAVSRLRQAQQPEAPAGAISLRLCQLIGSSS